RKSALTREIAEMTAPGQHIHRQFRRIGDLQEEDLVSRDVTQAGQVVAEREGVEAVENETESGMGCGFDDAPGMTPSIDVLAPGQCLEPDTQPALRRAFRHLRQI